MAAARRRQLRLSSSFDPLLRQAGLGLANESTVLRALIVLGLAHAGIAIDTLRPEVLPLLAAELGPEITQALARLYADQSTLAAQLYTSRSTAQEVPPVTPPPGHTSTVEPAQALSPLDVGLEF